MKNAFVELYLSGPKQTPLSWNSLLVSIIWPSPWSMVLAFNGKFKGSYIFPRHVQDKIIIDIQLRPLWWTFPPAIIERQFLFRSRLILSSTSRQADVGAASYTAWQGLYLIIYGLDMESHRRAFKDIMVFPGRDQQESVGAMEYATFYRGGNGKIPLSGRWHDGITDS